MEGLLNGRYRLGEPLVHEGPGELFAAQDLLTGSPCQVRVLPAQPPPGARGPLLEGRVRHPHLEALLASEPVLDPARGTSTGRWLVASERLEGETLGALPDQPAALARVGLGVLAALEGLASVGLSHGGLTPSRLLLTPGGVKLADPGLHRLSGEEPRYPAPEGRRDARADLYALGACLYEHATGRVPDPRRPIPLRELRSELPQALERAVALLLEEDPRRRAELEGVRDLLSQAAGSGALSPSRLPPTIDPSWVGRGELLAELEALATEAQTAAAAGRAARSAAPGPPTFLRLVAPAGYGKSRLLAEAGQRLCARGVVVLSGRVFEARDPAGAWRALLERAAEQGADPERLAAAHAALAEAADDLGAPVRYERVARPFLELAARRPTVILLDDAYLLDAAGAQLLIHLARAGGGLGLVTAEQPVQAPLATALAQPLAPPARTHELADLSDAEARALVRSMVPEGEPSEVERLAGLGGGSPFLLVELTREWRLGGETPRNVLEAVNVRLERAGPITRELLATLAVAGRPLPRAALEGLGLLGLEGALAEATGLGLLEEGGEAHGFRHGVTARVLLEELGEDERRAACERVLDALREDPSATAGERARLALQAGAPDAVQLALDAAPSDPDPAPLLQAALERMDASLERARVQRQLAARLIPRGAFADARRALELARADLAEHPDRQEEARACRLAARLAVAEGEAAEAQAWAARGRAVLTGEASDASEALPEQPAARALEDEQSQGVLAELYALEASICSNQGDHAGAIRRYGQARQASSDPLQRARLELREAGAVALSLERARFPAARRQASAARRALEVAGDRRGVMEAGRTLGVIAWYEGDAAAATARFREALELAEELADLTLAAGLLNNLGLTAQAQGELSQAEAYLERALDIAERSGQASVLCRAYTNVGRVRRALRDPDGALDNFAAGARVASAAGDPVIESAALSELGHTYLGLRRFEAALDAMRRSQELRRALGDVGRVAESELELGEAWRRAGDVVAALGCTARALALQASLGDPAGVAAAIEALEFVAGRPGGPAAALEAARQPLAPPRDAPPPIVAALARGEGLCRLALHLVAAALTGRAGDVEQVEGHVERAQQALAELEAGELHKDLVTLARSIAGEARAVAAAARGRLRDALAELEGASLGPQALREGALLLKRCFLLLAQDRADEASRALADLRALTPKLPEALADRRRVGDALVAAALRRLGVDAQSDAGLSLAQAGDVARRLGDVALLALVNSARAQEAQASGSPQEASLEQAAARAAAGRLVEGLPASLAEGLARTLVPPTHEAVPRASEATSDRELLLAMFGRVLSSKLELQPLLEAVLDALREATGAPRAALALRREGALEVAAAREIPPSELSEGTPRVVLEHVAREGLSARAAGRIPARFAPRSDGLSPPRSLLAVPLSREGQSEPLGAIYLDDPRPRGELGPDDAALATAFAAQVAAPIQNALGRAQQLGELARVAEAYRETARELGGEGSEGAPELVGRSQAMRTVQRLIERYGATRAPVTIMGESGTGKELVARALHRASPRRDEPFIVLNCTAVAATLLESELFGVEKGAYTGADKSRKGLFELAHTGTLFLDEVGDMSLEMQAKLLRVLETGDLRPVGSRKQVRVDVRIVSATHHDLRELVREGRFREDLLYRLNVLRVELPPLRERREDVLLLCNHFLDLVAERNGEPARTLAPDAAEAVLRHPWPGNVRELRNAIERACALESGPTISADRLLLETPLARPQPQGSAAPSAPPDYHKTYEFEGVALNRRQQRLLDHLRGGIPSITNREYCALVQVSERTGLRDLTHLVKSELLVRIGRRKGARYELAPSLRG